MSVASWRKRYAAHSLLLSRSAPAADGEAPPWVPVLVREDVAGAQQPFEATCYILAADTERLEVPRVFDAREVAS